jgi:hypothetical protein
MWERYIKAIKAAYPNDMPPEIQLYLETFEAESTANHEARNQAFDALDEDTRRRLVDIHRRVEPQLFQ